jgi:hypothetical protein
VSAVDPLATLYAACTAVEEGKVAEVELEYRTTSERDGVSTEEILMMTVRRDIKHIKLGGGTTT